MDCIENAPIAQIACRDIKVPMVAFVMPDDNSIYTMLHLNMSMNEQLTEGQLRAYWQYKDSYKTNNYTMYSVLNKIVWG